MYPETRGASAANHEFSVRPLQPYIGAEIRDIDLRTPLTPAGARALRQVWLQHKVLVFRDQDLTRDQHLALGRSFGALDRHPTFAADGYPEILPIREDPSRDAGEWHSDLSYLEAPPAGALLRAIELPELGGDTVFVNAAAAFARLDEATSARVAALSAVHDPCFDRYVTDPEKLRLLARANPPRIHPVVTEHPETGEGVLFVNRFFTRAVAGMEQRSSDELLGALFRHLYRPEYQLRVRWRPGTVVFWDNRATQHYPVTDYSGSRYLERVTLVGEPPVARRPSGQCERVETGILRLEMGC